MFGAGNILGAKFAHGLIFLAFSKKKIHQFPFFLKSDSTNSIE
jgi:hypothetical protein